MPQENFSTLIPQQGDTPEILRMKHAFAAARVVEPATVTVRFLECFGYGESWQPVVSTPTYFRRAYVWGGTLAGAANHGTLRLRHGTNDNRLISPGQMLVIEALPGQQLNLQAFQFYGSYYYYADSLAWELY